MFSGFIGLGCVFYQREGVGIVNRQFLGVGEGVGRVALVRQVQRGATEPRRDRVRPGGIGQGLQGQLEVIQVRQGRFDRA